jgi:hypothetical protein
MMGFQWILVGGEDRDEAGEQLEMEGVRMDDGIR